MRRNNGRRLRACEICDVTYRPTYSGQRTCSRKCGVELQYRNGRSRGRQSEVACRIYIRNCDQCGALFTGRRSNMKRCSDECRHAANNAIILASVKRRYAANPEVRDQVIARSQARRASKLGLGNLTVTLTYLIQRDHGRCGICRKPVRASRGPRRPSIDHIVPLARGGTHDLANLQLAHLSCNLAKHARGGGEQLLLIG